jgi:hypothetical protein
MPDYADVQLQLCCFAVTLQCWLLSLHPVAVSYKVLWLVAFGLLKRCSSAAVDGKENILCGSSTSSLCLQ